MLNFVVGCVAGAIWGASVLYIVSGQYLAAALAASLSLFVLLVASGVRL